MHVSFTTVQLRFDSTSPKELVLEVRHRIDLETSEPPEQHP